MIKLLRDVLQIVVHEIGHNLGMKHDFEVVPILGIPLPRFSSQFHLCSNPLYYMDYGKFPKTWSPCSVEDFTKYYNDVISVRGKFCLETT